MKHKILFCHKQHIETIRYVKKLLDENKYFLESCDSKELKEKIKDADVAIPLMGKLTKEIIESAEKLKLIQQFGVGLEGVDIETATKKKIYVANVPAHDTGNAYSVSELTLFFILALLKQYNKCQEAFKNKMIGYPLGDTLIDKKFLILGYGNVGKAIVDILKPFKVNITVATRRLRESKGDIKFITFNDLDKLIENIDFLIIALPLTKETKDMIDEKILFTMKKDSYLINVGRGGIVKYEALLEALKKGYIRGAGLDVFWEEPFNPKDEILNYNVIVTPHIAGSTKLSYNLISKVVADNIIKVLEKKLPPDNWVNQSF